MTRHKIAAPILGDFSPAPLNFTALQTNKLDLPVNFSLLSLSAPKGVTSIKLISSRAAIVKVFKPVPCCYRFGIDVPGAADKKGMDWRNRLAFLMKYDFEFEVY